MHRRHPTSLLVLLVYLPFICPLTDGSYVRVIDTPPIEQPSGAMCSFKFMIRQYTSGSEPTVARSRALCKDYGVHGPPASVGQPQTYSTIRLRDVTTFFNAVSKRYNRSPIARTFLFFAESDKMCLSVRFRAIQFKAGGEYSFTNIRLTYRMSQPNLECPVTESLASITHIVCVHDNCTLPEKPTPPPSTPIVIAQNSQNNDEHKTVIATVKQCMNYLRNDVISMDTYNQHRLWVIVAGVACNLISMAFLAGLIHYCLKYRHLRRHLRMIAGPMGSLGPGSLAGTASPTPAVRHLGSTVSSGAQLLHLSPSGGAYPDYQYSSIARRKLKNQQQQQHRHLLLHQNGSHHPLDDETMSYRSDHARLLMPSSNGANHIRHGSLSGSTLQRHNSGAVSPPRGWGPNEAPSTPGSIRRHDSISAMSMTSSGYPRRNGALPAPPAHMLKQPPPHHTPPPPPPPPPADPQGTVVY